MLLDSLRISRSALRPYGVERPATPLHGKFQLSAVFSPPRLRSGFIPQSQNNPCAVHHGDLADDRVMAKPGMLLCSLDQVRIPSPRPG